jgi:lactoylglutathione lyase
MKLGYTIIYVPNVESTLKFYGHAFGLQQKFLHESGDYGELSTGETTLAFASHALGELNFPQGYVKASESKQPLGMEIALVTQDVQCAHNSAIAYGATEVSAPTQKPWGQVVSYVRAPDGTLVELCTPIQP